MNNKDKRAEYHTYIHSRQTISDIVEEMNNNMLITDDQNQYIMEEIEKENRG